MHDAKGRPLAVGDTILVPYKITTTYQTEGDGYCNVSAETIASMYPGVHRTGGTFNAKQVLRANEDDDTSYETVHNADGSTSIR